jgi:conjugal transfer pilin signal peptidase TrbI|tara:strand:+ start:10209 stop:10685 length:477 start_codon:yes stop_codon:yes gene_type:complete
MASWKAHKVGWTLAAIASVTVMWNVTMSRWSFGLNMTESLPYWAFVIDGQDRPERGELAFFTPPPNPYYDTPFVKRVLGVAGDVIEVRNREVFINGHLIGRAKTHDQQGRAVDVIEPQTIAEGWIFVGGDHVDSYDSRYAEFGLVPDSQVLGRATPIL